MVTTERLSIVIPADNVPGPEQGEWTYADYAALPDDGRRYEIVKGVLLVAPSPNRWHQQAVGRLYRYLAASIEDAGLGLVFMAPFDVQLSEKNVFQPDVLVMLNTSLHKLVDKKVIGAPDLVVEVASPSTAALDRLSKYDVYAEAGVPEYWIANPETRSIEVLVLEAGGYRSLGRYSGQEILPARIVSGYSARVEQFFASPE